MKDYVRQFNGSSITTEQWRTHLFHFFTNQPNGQEYLRALGKVDWDEVSRLTVLTLEADKKWLHGDGLDLCVNIEYDDSLAKPVR